MIMEYNIMYMYVREQVSYLIQIVRKGIIVVDQQDARSAAHGNVFFFTLTAKVQFFRIGGTKVQLQKPLFNVISSPSLESI